MKKPTQKSPAKKSWITQKEKIILKTKIFEVIRRRSRSSETPSTHDFYLLRSQNWCNIIPITPQGRVVFVRQFRAGISDFTLEIPGGVCDSKDSSPRAAALRELCEETGYSPLPGSRCFSLGWIQPNPAIQNNQCFCFVVGPVIKKTNQNLDSGEMIDVVEIPLHKIPQYISKGKIRHTLMLNTFLLLLLHNTSAQKLLQKSLQQFTQKKQASSLR